MKTFMANPQNVEKKWYVIDAEGIVLGRLASEVASILRGKNKPTYTPNVDCGDYVIVINCDKIKLTGKKLTDKFYRTHSGFGGGFKEVPYKEMMADKSDFVVEWAVKGMLPKNALGRKMLKHLKTYKGDKHENEAQQPIVWNLRGGKKNYGNN